MDSSSSYVLGDTKAYEAEKRKDPSSSEFKVKKRKKNDPSASLGIDMEEDGSGGPWAPYEDPVKSKMEAEMQIKIQENILQYSQTLPVATDSKSTEQKESKEAAAVVEKAEPANTYIIEPEEEDEMWEKKNERKLNNILPPRYHPLFCLSIIIYYNV